MIKQISLEHKGGSYFYSVNNDKLDKVSRFDQLKKYLYDIFNNCPHHYFNSGPRGSTLRFDSGLEIKKVMGHEISSLAKQGLQDDSFNSNHFPPYKLSSYAIASGCIINTDLAKERVGLNFLTILKNLGRRKFNKPEGLLTAYPPGSVQEDHRAF